MKVKHSLGRLFSSRPMWKAARCGPHYGEPQSCFPATHKSTAFIGPLFTVSCVHRHGLWMVLCDGPAQMTSCSRPPVCFLCDSRDTQRFAVGVQTCTWVNVYSSSKSWKFNKIYYKMLIIQTRSNSLYYVYIYFGNVLEEDRSFKSLHHNSLFHFCGIPVLSKQNCLEAEILST